MNEISQKNVSPAEVGGKAHNLARLRQAGFPVPDGFCISTAAYRHQHSVDGQNEIHAEIKAEILKAWRTLGQSAIAVRSSAVDEDSQEASFAGQYQTFLNVTAEADLLEAIKKCWASLKADSAEDYRRIMLESANAPALAVVVQRMVPARMAGVAFSLNPITQADEIIVETTVGLGEKLVSGNVTPASFRIDKQSADINQISSGDSNLSPEELNGLAELGGLVLQIERYFDCPQDIEWAWDGEKFYILQSRPITTALHASPTIRTRDNVGEVAPEAFTPLSWSVLGAMGNEAFAGVLHRLGIKEIQGQLFGQFYGRIYLNQTFFQSVMSRYYLSTAGWKGIPRLAITALSALNQMRLLSKEGEEIIAQTWAKHRLESGFESLSAAQLLDKLAEWRAWETKVMEVHLAVTVMGELLYQALDKLLARKGNSQLSAAGFTSHLNGVRSAEAGQALARLANDIQADTALQEMLLQVSPDKLADKLPQTEAGAKLWQDIQTFLVEYGHTALQEFELAAPRWRDDPTIVLGILQNRVRSARQVQQNEPGIVQPEAGISLKWLVKLVRKFAALRENLKDAYVLAHGNVRSAYLVLARLMISAGALDEAENIFFLSHNDLLNWQSGQTSAAQTLDKARAQQQEWERVKERPSPFALQEWPDGKIIPQARSENVVNNVEGTELKGIAVSVGSFVGQARVATCADEAAQLQPGEVLVVQAVTPGWSPLLHTAGALVTEIGGALSHGAIIAREYGLPAVLNIPGATSRIKTGQAVHVDGSLGIVKLLDSNY